MSGDSAQKRALLIIDVQSDFLPGGSLAVPDGQEIIPVINFIQANATFDVTVFTQDWHPPSHVSFASSHPPLSPFSLLELDYTSKGELCSGAHISPNYSVPCRASDIATRLNQTLWPDHCLQNSSGAEISANVTRSSKNPVVQKGYHIQIDSYSAFWDNGHVSTTSLQQLLISLEITQIFVVGLALDFCVFYTAMDGHAAGYETFVVQDASRGITPSGVDAALSAMKAAGIFIINSTSIPP
jgi:nicotinamidase/pyrazinamidase